METSQATVTRTRRAAGALGGALLLLAAIVPAASAQDEEPLKIAFLSYAVANTYDEPIQKAIEGAAAAGGAEVQVFDANYDANLQATQLQDAVASGEFQGILVQPIQGAGLVAGVEAAIAAGIAVGNVDQDPRSRHDHERRASRRVVGERRLRPERDRPQAR